MFRRCLFATLWGLFSSWAAADDLAKAKVIHFDILFRKDSELGRKLVDAYKNSFSKLGYEFQADQLPTRRGIEELKNNRLDGSVGRVSNLVSDFGIQNFVRLEVPVVYTTMSLWCNKDSRAMQALKKPRVSYLHGSNYASRVVGEIEDKSVIVTAVNGYHNMITMMRKDRLDCFVATTTNMDTEQIGMKELQGFYRHSLVTMPAYPWIAKKYEHLKDPLEKDLLQLVSDKEWRKLYFEDRARCSEAFYVLCPDGRIFVRQVQVALGQEG